MKSKKNKNGILYWTRILATAIGILSVFGTVMYFVIDGFARSEERGEFIQKMNVIINENQKTYLELVEKYYSEQLTLLKELSSYKEESNSMINKTNSNIDKIHKQIDGTLIPILEDISNREIYRVDLSELIMMQNEFELLKDSLISKLEQLDKQPGSPDHKFAPNIAEEYFYNPLDILLGQVPPRSLPLDSLSETEFDSIRSFFRELMRSISPDE